MGRKGTEEGVKMRGGASKKKGGGGRRKKNQEKQKRRDAKEKLRLPCAKN